MFLSQIAESVVKSVPFAATFSTMALFLIAFVEGGYILRATLTIILPAGETGAYWANEIPVDSTLSAQTALCVK
jgi:hypothetical protein